MLFMFHRLVRWCYENPRLFWAIVIVGGIGDVVFLTWYFSWGGKKGKTATCHRRVMCTL